MISRLWATKRYIKVWHWLVALTILLAGSFCALVYYAVQPVPTSLKVTAAVRKLSFNIAEDANNAGIFNSSRVDIVLTDPVILHPDQGPDLRCSASTSFQHVTLLRMSASQNMHFTLSVGENNSLHYSLRRPLNSPDPFLVLSDEGPAPKNLPCTLANDIQPASKKIDLAPGNWRIQTTESGIPLDFSVRFLKPHGKLLQESNLALTALSDMALEGVTPSHEPNNEIRYNDSGEIKPLTDDLELEGVSRGTISDMTFDPASGSLHVVASGLINRITAVTGKMTEERNDARYAALQQFISNKVLDSLGLFLTGVGTLFSGYVALHDFLRRNRTENQEVNKNHQDGKTL